MNTVMHIDDEKDEKPLDPEVEAVRRRLARLLMVSIGIMMAGLMAVLVAIVYKFSSRPDVDQPAVATVSGALPALAPGLTFAVPSGAEIVSQSLSGAHVSFDLSFTDGRRELHIFDMTKNETVAVVAIRQ